jgi:RNA-directed DNA polymerase
VKDRSQETLPPTVATGPGQGGDVRSQWAWTEPAVWTERMLGALVNGVKGGVWFSLMDKVCSPKNLSASWERVRRNGGAAGVDRQSVEQFSAKAEANLKWLHEKLREQQYRPMPVRRTWIPKMGTTKLRPLGIPTVRDRIVQGALRNVLEPIFERRFDEHSYGFRPGRGCKDALRRVDDLLGRGYRWVVDADIQSYFDTIPHGQLMQEVRREIADGSVLALVEGFLKQSVMDELKEYLTEQGTPQGAVISPLLANIYLHPVDLMLRDGGFEVVRYADDLVILCETEERAREALRLLDEEITRRGLKLHPEKTRIVDITLPGGFDFLGYHFELGRKTPREKSLAKFKDSVRELTPRTAGRSIDAVIKRLNAVVSGWFEYFKHSHVWTFEPLDGWIRSRLRAILLRHKKRRGTGHGYANRRWPNSFFAKHGLFSLSAAHAEASRPH